MSWCHIKVALDSRHDLDSDDVLKLSYIVVVTILFLNDDECALVEDFLWTMAEDVQAIPRCRKWC